jgi:3-oxoacyl-[acyl-carrier protein] reductase
MPGRLEGKTALVTGSTRGIGLATARAFAREGALVGVCSRKADEAAKAAAGLSEVGKAGVAYALDVSNRAEVDRVVEDFAARAGGRLDILVNNAGLTRDTLLVRMTDEQWDEVIRTNLNSVFYATRTAVKRMMRNRPAGGRIINVTSVSAIMGNPGQANYAASKGGIIAFTKTVAKEYAGRGITVNAIAPGFIRTALTDLMTEQAQATIMDNIPLGRFGEPDDIAGPILFLASDEASYVTGHVLQVDGGLAM